MFLCEVSPVLQPGRAVGGCWCWCCSGVLPSFLPSVLPSFLACLLACLRPCAVPLLSASVLPCAVQLPLLSASVALDCTATCSSRSPSVLPCAVLPPGRAVGVASCEVLGLGSTPSLYIVAAAASTWLPLGLGLLPALGLAAGCCPAGLGRLGLHCCAVLASLRGLAVRRRRSAGRVPLLEALAV